jgi:nuclear transport factor 2 (NTF2) superfamily protein
MLVNTNNAFFASFSNENYEIDEEGSRYIINKSIHKEIKKGNLNDL